MKQDTLKSLHCPYCGSGLELTDNSNVRAGQIHNAIVECNCGSYPVVEGILALSAVNPAVLTEAVQCLKLKKTKEALLLLLEPITGMSRVIRALKYHALAFGGAIEYVRQRIAWVELNKMLGAPSFLGAAEIVKSYAYSGYFKYRYSYASFIAGLPLIYLMNNSKGSILEIGSGMGHHGFAISQLYPARPFVGVDFSFANLYLSKRFFATGAEYICLDANDPLPFNDSSFSVVYSCDTLHYLRSKKNAMQEIERVLDSENPLLLLSHLHNRNAKEPVCGQPLSTQGWLSLPRRLKARLFSQGQILKDLFSKGILDLTANITPEQTLDEGVFNLVGTQAPELFRLYEDAARELFKVRGRIALNPLYDIKLLGDKAHLKKKWPSRSIYSENLDVDRFFPDNLCFERKLVEDILMQKESLCDEPRVNELMKELVLINVPQYY